MTASRGEESEWLSKTHIAIQEKKNGMLVDWMEHVNTSTMSNTERFSPTKRSAHANPERCSK